MPEILTESFCERCGTRYTFEAVTPKARPLKKLKILSKGLKTYVLSDETTLDEALADARSDEQRAVSSQQLDAFHKTFNFCMTCRQYTCANCWNEVEGRCLTCAPHLGHEVMPGPFPMVDLRSTAQDVASTPEGTNGQGIDDGRMIEASAWPTVDLRPNAPLPAPPQTPVRPVEPDRSTETPATTTEDTAAAATARTRSLFARFRPGRGHDAAASEPAWEEAPVAEEAPVLADVTRGLTPEELADVSAATALARAAGAEPEDVVAVETEPGVAAESAGAAVPEVDAEPAVDVEPEVIAAPEVDAEPLQPQPDDRVELPTWRIVAPDTGGPAAATGPAPAAVPGMPGGVPIAPQRPAVAPAEPQWPTTTEWAPQPTQWPAPLASASHPSGAGPAFAPRPPAVSDVLWAASSRDVLNRPGSGVQACVSCGLPLSATARFCRRCGTRQG